MPVNDEFTLTYVQSVHNTRLTNVLNYQQTSGDGAGDPRKALADGWFASDAKQGYLDQLGPLWTDLCAEVRQRDLPGQDFFRVLSEGDTGGALSTLNPATAIQLVHFPAISGPGQQGSVFISGAPLTDEFKNNLAQASYATYVSWAEDFMTSIVNSGFTFQLGLPSRPFIAADPGADPPVVGQTQLDFRAFVLADVRVPLTKIQSRRLNTRC